MTPDPITELSSGTYTPQQFATIQTVFMDVIAQPWFSQSPEKHQEFAHFVIEAYRRGFSNPERLRAFCLEAAMERYAVMSGPGLLQARWDAGSKDHYPGKANHPGH